MFPSRHSSVRQALLFALVALGASGSLAAPPSDADVQALFESPGLKRWIADGVVMRNMLHENVRRAMMLERCSVMKNGFPRKHVPGLEFALEKAEAWAFGGDRSLISKRYDAVADMRASITAIARQGLAQTDLDAWRSYRESAQGQRAARLASIDLGIDAVSRSGATVDVLTGVRWDWPLARLRQLADEVALRAEFDAAVNRAVPGSAKVVARVSDGFVDSAATSAETDTLVQAIESGALSTAWIASLSAADRAALKQYQEHPAALRWGDEADAFQKVVVLGGDLQAACRRFGISSCEAGGTADRSFKAMQARFREHMENQYGLPDFRAMAKKIPEAGCSSR